MIGKGLARWRWATKHAPLSLGQLLIKDYVAIDAKQAFPFVLPEFFQDYRASR
jgi:hypothetical protein